MRFTAAYLAAVAVALVGARPQDLTVPTESLPTSGSAIDPLPTSTPSLSFSLPGPISVSDTSIFSNPSGSESLQEPSSAILLDLALDL
ncbi:hypothetical protein CPB85DRAFT_1448583 [Mucidula mucida]|nr:hypothetical protein CPB85DRAFT_1448583 [Mucidula mucida]